MDVPLEQLRENATRASKLLKSMANRSRLMILCLLAEREMTVTELCDAVELSQSALSQHLGVLRRDGLVETRRESQFIWYSLASNEAEILMNTLYQLFCADDDEGAEPR